MCVCLCYADDESRESFEKNLGQRLDRKDILARDPLGFITESHQYIRSISAIDTNSYLILVQSRMMSTLQLLPLLGESIGFNSMWQAACRRYCTDNTLLSPFLIPDVPIRDGFPCTESCTCKQKPFIHISQRPLVGLWPLVTTASINTRPYLSNKLTARGDIIRISKRRSCFDRNILTTQRPLLLFRALQFHE